MELLKRIRAFNPTIRVIVVTGNRDPVRAREALELGALAYVDKPFDLAYSSAWWRWRSDRACDHGARLVRGGEKSFFRKSLSIRQG
jgi:DNA-binding NtrC family response regulator